MLPDRERNRSLALGEAAMGHIKSHTIAAVPRNYEIWYAYASGADARLKEALEKVIANQAVIDQTHLDAIFSVYFVQENDQGRVEAIGDIFSQHLGQIIHSLDEAAYHSSSFGADLAGAATLMKTAASPEMLRATIEAALASTRAVEANNRALKQRLETSLQEAHQLNDKLEAIRTESLLDPLTTLWNRKFYDQAIDKCLSEARRNGSPLSLVVADVDHFKKFNDTYGHLTGDQVLRLVGFSLKQHLKGKDLACRYGGEEFVLILPDTPIGAAADVANQIRRLVMGKELLKRSSNENLGRVTLSLGVATLRPDDTAASLYDRADRGLYAAKRTGRNKVICESDPELVGNSPPHN